MTTLFHKLDVRDSEGTPLFSGSGNAHLGATADVHLCDGIKSPDFSLYENDPNQAPMLLAMPTVVWEVAYSEDEKKLAYDLGRHIACSFGLVRLAIGVNIERNRIGGVFRGVKQVTCALWEADYAQEFATLKASGSATLDQLVRCDDYANEADDCVVPAATQFSCVSKHGDKYWKIVAAQQVLYTAGSFPLYFLSTL
jgi:hypothetical protein